MKGPGYVWILETAKEKAIATQLLKIESEELEMAAQGAQ
jgi:transposase